jgi:glycosyltransferase involved in cell wall biosynthesis
MTDTNRPLVSMIVVCYNHARFVLETLDSVEAQTYTNTELVIIDDCSTDDSVAVIERWLRQTGTVATFIRHERNMGVCRTLNDALAVTKGKYISMIASDDLWLPEKIEQQVEIMESQPDDVGVLYSDAFQIDANGQCDRALFLSRCWNFDKMPEGKLLDILVQMNFIPGPTTLIRRSCYDKVGLYDEALLYEDWDMWMRIARHYSFVYAPEPSAKYRIHAASFCGDRKGFPRGTFEVFAKQLRLGGLSENQRAAVLRNLLVAATELYERRDKHAPEKLRVVWELTGRGGPLWMSRFAAVKLPFRVWREALSCYTGIVRLRSTARAKLMHGTSKSA